MPSCGMSRSRNVRTKSRRHAALSAFVLAVYERGNPPRSQSLRVFGPTSDRPKPKSSWNASALPESARRAEASGEALPTPRTSRVLAAGPQGREAPRRDWDALGFRRARRGHEAVLAPAWAPRDAGGPEGSRGRRTCSSGRTPRPRARACSCRLVADRGAPRPGFVRGAHGRLRHATAARASP